MHDKHVHSSNHKDVSRMSIVVPAFFVALVTFLVFLPALKNDIVNWDDPLYVWENLNIRSFDMAFVKWLFTSLVVSNWHPLTMLSHALDYHFFGLEPWGHHFTSLVIHALNTFMVYVVAHTLYARYAARYNEQDSSALYAFIAAITTSLFFGLHPIHVESVVWLSERKDVLCGFFYLLSIIFYLNSTKGDSGRKSLHALSIFSFLLALMSKPMAVSLPVVLLIIDYFPLGRLERHKYAGALIEKIPFVILALAFSIITLLSQSSTGAIARFADTSLYERVLVSARAYGFYLYKILWPAELAPLYPYPADISLGSLNFLVPVLLFISITLFCIFMFRRLRLLLPLWAYYVVTLLPVIGIVRVGQQAAADRYTYLPVIAPFLLAGFALVYIARRFKSKGSLAVLALFLILLSALLSSLTIKQTSIWKDSLTLWSYEISLYPTGSHIPYTNRGAFYEDRDRFDLAIADYNKAIEVAPIDANTYVNRGDFYYRTDEIIKATGDFEKAIEIRPEHTGAHISLGVISQDSGDLVAAIKRFNMAIDSDNESSSAYLHRGIALVKMGRFESGVEDIEKAIELGGQGAESYNARALALYNLRSFKSAEEDYKIAIEKDPSYAEAYYNLALLYSHLGQRERARENYEKALELGLKEAEEALRTFP